MVTAVLNTVKNSIKFLKSNLKRMKHSYMLKVYTANHHQINQVKGIFHFFKAFNFQVILFLRSQKKMLKLLQNQV